MPAGFGARRLPAFDWHGDVQPVLQARYQLRGLAKATWDNDWSLLRRVAGPKHPNEVTVEDMERVLLSANRAGSRVVYIVRFKVIWKTLRAIGVVDQENQPDEALPKIRKPRAVPRPISKAAAELFMREGRGEIKEWAILGCLAGLRAKEVSAIEGSWLEETVDGYTLRVRGGKGDSDLPVLAHPKVVEVLKSHKTLGRLYRANPAGVSERANKEMKRLGINATFHACRHFFATYLLEKSHGDILLVAELCRHSNLNTTRGYAALQQGRKRAVLDQLFAEAGEVAHAVAATA